MQAGNLTNFFKVKPGELRRWYIVNPGPNGYIAFHFIAGMMDVRDGSVRGIMVRLTGRAKLGLYRPALLP